MTTDNKFTPGPWNARKVFIENAPCRYMVIPRSWGAVAIADCGESSETSAANAALMAAAPDMLAVLRECREVLVVLAAGKSRIDGKPARITHSHAVTLGHRVAAVIEKATS